MKKLILLSALILSSCGTKQAKISKDMFLIETKGYGFSSDGSVRKSFLKDCAESTIENGFDFFIVTDEESTKKSFGTKPSRSGMVKAFKAGTQPQGAYNAKELLSALD